MKHLGQGGNHAPELFNLVDFLGDINCQLHAVLWLVCPCEAVEPHDPHRPDYPFFFGGGVLFIAGDLELPKTQGNVFLICPLNNGDFSPLIGFK